MSRTPGLQIAVAGGHGFIGRRLCAALRARGDTPIPFGREGPPAHAPTDRDAPPTHALRDAPPARAPTVCDALVWAAGGRSPDLAVMHEAHVAAPLRALAALRPRRVVYLSSAEVYGRIPVPFREADEPRPETPYGQAKHAGEQALRAACTDLATPLVILRPTVVYGPGQTPTMLLPAALAALRAGHDFPATAGTQTRDFIHVDDLGALILRCLAADAPTGTFNAGSGHELPIRDVLLQLAAHLGPAALAHLQLGAVPARAGEAMRYVIDPTRSATLLGWRTTISLADGLRALARAPHQ